MRIILFNIFLILVALGLGFYALMATNALVTIACSFAALFVASQISDSVDYNKEKR